MNGLLVNGLVALPAGFALLAWLLPRRGGDVVALSAAVVGSFLTLAWSATAVGATGGSLDLAGVDQAWVAGLGVRWHLGLDGVSGPLVLMSALVFACALLSLLRHAPACGARVDLAALLLLIEAGVLGSFVALDLVVFFVFFEVALIPMWFVIRDWGDRHDEAGRHRAANRFLLFTVLGSALMLVGFLLVGGQAGTFDIVEIADTYRPEGPVGVAASVLVAVGLAVKTPLWPLHIWLPDAHAKAPTVGSVVLAAVLLKLGSYGFLRFWMPVTDPSWRVVVPFVAGLAVVGIVYAALACLAQSDLKRLIAYSSVGHMGFVVLAAATFTVGGVQAAVFASVAHGVVTGLLFFLAGAVKDRYDTGELSRLSVLYGRVPHLAALFAFAAMASLGLPGLAGFWGEMLAIRSALFSAAALPGPTYVVLAVVAALGVILTSAYFLTLLRGMLQGTPVAVRPVNEDVDSIELASAEVEPASPMAGALRSDVDALEWAAWSPLAVVVLVLGVAPGLLLTPVAEAVRTFLPGLA